jgi:hypothetical protein
VAWHQSSAALQSEKQWRIGGESVSASAWRQRKENGVMAANANESEMKIVINRVSIMKYQHQRHGVWRMAWIEIKQSI